MVKSSIHSLFSPILKYLINVSINSSNFLSLLNNFSFIKSKIFLFCLYNSSISEFPFSMNNLISSNFSFAF